MLQVRNISKTYVTGDLEQKALDHVSLDLRDNEFVAILGPSGSGKTTLLNVIGGLDRYDSGDLIIDGTSTKEYTDKDWDAYRNHTIGFVFQSYNLIPHQTILSNVELALTISGVSSAERKKIATEALDKVGLREHINKKPSQLSGGQMQRVAIARALVNNPDIILADEPTGALDSKTSVQIMELLKEVAKDRLVIMVTHNPELADQYATRIVRLKDGKIVADTSPVNHTGVQIAKTKPKHTRLGFWTALSLSVNNLLTKKGRTFLTSFAGSVGIIGIALILALSNGVNTYIKSMEGDMLGSYPVQLQSETLDVSSMVSQTQNNRQQTAQTATEGGDVKKSNGSFQSDGEVAQALTRNESLYKQNDLKAFKTYLDAHKNQLSGSINSIEYGYDIEPQIFRNDDKSGLVKVYPSSLSLKQESNDLASNLPAAQMLSGDLKSSWNQMPSSKNLRNSQYDLVAGKWPTKYNEVALILDTSNQVSDYTLYTLGLMDMSQLSELVADSQNGKEIKATTKNFSYNDIIGKTFSCFSPASLYTKSDGIYVDRSSDEDYMASHLGEGTELVFTAVIQSKNDQQAQSGVAYSAALTQYLLQQTAATPVVQEQLANPDRNVLTGKAFSSETNNSSGIGSYVSGLLSAYTSMGAEEKPGVSSAVAGSNSGSRSSGSSAKAKLLPAFRSAVMPTAYAASSKKQGGLFDALLNYTRSLLEKAVMEAFQNLISEDQAASMVKQYINSLSDEEKQQLVSQFTQNLSKEDIQQIAQQYGGNMSEADMQKYAQQYLGSMSDAERQQLIQQFVGSMSTKDMEKLASQYIGNMSQAEIESIIGKYAKNMNSAQMQSIIMDYLSKHQDELLEQVKKNLNPAQIQAMMAGISNDTPNTYDDVMKKLSYTTVDEPSSISIYPIDFDGKQVVEDFIKQYNAQVKDPNEKVTYTDLIATVTKSITDVIDTVSYVLIAFVAISLIVSSIMIAIITYISVLERTKEIGILRALGSSKNDISLIFNAETFIEGFISGLLGIAITLLLCIPINQFALHKYNIARVAILPWQYSLLLIAISIVLTFLAGFIPSRLAAKKDPVAALRTE